MRSGKHCRSSPELAELVGMAITTSRCLTSPAGPVANYMWHGHVQAHFIVDEMLMNGCLVETNKQNVLQPVQLLEKAAA